MQSRSSSSKNATLRFSDTWEFQKEKSCQGEEAERSLMVEVENEKQISCTTHKGNYVVVGKGGGGLNKDDNPCPVFSSPHYDPPGWHHIAKSR